MEIYLYRHGQTLGNAAAHFIGSTDEHLSEKGIAQLKELPTHPEVKLLYTSHRRRALESAAILFPNAEVVQIPDLCEMNFGEFENVDKEVLHKDPRYQAWMADETFQYVCPSGESIQIFMDRVQKAFEKIVADEMAKGTEKLYLIAHGGVTMATRTLYVKPKKNNFIWWSVCKNGGYWHFHLDEKTWETEKELKVIEQPEFMFPDNPDVIKMQQK